MSPMMASPALIPMPYWIGSPPSRSTRGCGGPQGLGAGVCLIGLEPEKREHAIADELVRLAARFANATRGGVDKAIDEKHDVEGQTRLPQAGRDAPINKT